MRNLKEILIVLVLFAGLYSCEGQVRIDGETRSNPNGVIEYGFEKWIDTIYIDKIITEIDTIIEERIVIQIDTIIEERIVEVEVIKEIEVIVRDTIVEEVEVVVHDTIIKEIEVVVRDTVIRIPEPKIEEFTTISDPILLDFTDSLVKPTNKADIYVMVYGIGLVHLQNMDTIHKFQRHYSIRKTTDFESGVIKYENLELPFQFRDAFVMEKTSSSVKIRAWMTEQCHIQYIVNGEVHEASSEDFNAGEISSIQYQHTRTLGGLSPDTEYLIKIFLTSESGAVDLRELRVKTDL